MITRALNFLWWGKPSSRGMGTGYTDREISVLLILVSLVYLIFLFPSPEFPVYNPDDGARFITLAQNLVEYGRYTGDTFPVENYGHHATWPPLYMWMLAGLIGIFGVNWYVLKFVMVLMGLAALYLLLRFWRGNRLGFWAVVLTALSPMFFLYSHHAMMEVPYILAIVATLLAIQNSTDWKTALFAGLLGTAAFFTRGYAVTLIPAAALFYLSRREWLFSERLSAAVAFILPMIIGVLVWKGYTGYVVANYPVDWVTAKFGTGSGVLEGLFRSPVEQLQRWYWNDGRYAFHLLAPVFSRGVMLESDLAFVASGGLLVLAAFGWIITVRNRLGILEYWLPIAMAFQFIMPSSGVRYWLIFLPFIAYYMLVAFSAISRLDQRFNKVLPAGLGVLLLLGGAGLVQHLSAPDRLRFTRPEALDYRDMAIWARDHLPKSALFIVGTPHWFYAVSQRNALSSVHELPVTIETDAYLVCAQGGSSKSTVKECAEFSLHGRWPLVHSEGVLRLYKYSSIPDSAAVRSAVHG